MEKKSMRVWWCPQIGTDTFYVPVHSVEEAKKVMDILAYYDCFLMNQEIRGDYCNAGGLEVWDDKEEEWCDWYFEDEITYFDDVDEYIKVMSNESHALEAASHVMAEQVHFD